VITGCNWIVAINKGFISTNKGKYEYALHRMIVSYLIFIITILIFYHNKNTSLDGYRFLK